MTQGTAPDRAAGRDGLGGRIEELCAALPVLIVIYFALQAVFRIAISGNLEIDEAEVASRTGFLLGYANSHPPLYEWIAFSLRAVFGSWPVAFAVLRACLLTATFLLIYRAGHVLTGTRTGAALMALSLFFMPEIAWQSQITLAHSVLALCASAGVIAALVLLSERVTWPRALLLAAALAAALLSKYNTLLLVGALGAAILATPRARERLRDARVGAGIAIGVALAAPHYLWALLHLGQATERLSRVTTPHPFWSRFDIPALGVDGFVTLVVGLLSSAGPLVALWCLGRRVSRREADHDGPPSDLGRLWIMLSGRALMLALGALAAGIVLADIHLLHDRYLTPLLLLVPVWLNLRFPLAPRPRAARRTALLPIAIAAAILVAWPATVLFGPHIFAYPYAALAEQMSGQAPAGTAIAMPRNDDAVNMHMRLNGSTLFDPSQPAGAIAALWSDEDDEAEHLLLLYGQCYSVVGPVRRYVAPYRYFSGGEAGVSLAILRRPAPSGADNACMNDALFATRARP